MARTGGVAFAVSQATRKTALVSGFLRLVAAASFWIDKTLVVLAMLRERGTHVPTRKPRWREREHSRHGVSLPNTAPNRPREIG